MKKQIYCGLKCATMISLASVLLLNTGATLAQGKGVQSGEPSRAPFLRLETGMHTAPIREISMDRENRYLVTASDDKTVRVWELPSGRLLRILRPPVGSGDEGKLYAVALSPDGRTIAVGGYPLAANSSVYIFDRESGRMLWLITGLPNVIVHLTYSVDGNRLAATIGRNGLRIYETAGYTQIFTDSDYGDRSEGADFDQAGRLVTSCWDGFLRLYEPIAGDRALRLVAKRRVEGGERPASVNFSPDGSQVAVGFEDSTKVAVVSGRDLSPIFLPNTDTAYTQNFHSVAWSMDGRMLFAGGMPHTGGPNWIRYWTDGGRGQWRETTVANDTVVTVLPARGGGVVFGTQDPAFGRLDSGGKRTLLIATARAVYQAMLEMFLLSWDGTSIQFAYESFGKSPALFSFNGRQLTAVSSSSTSAGLKSPITSSLAVTDWKDSHTPKLNGQPLKLEPYELSRSIAIAPDPSRFLLGTGWWLRFFDRGGKELWSSTIPGEAWGVNISGDGHLAVAALGDGTIRWYRITDGKELLAFFPHNDRRRWALWTPSGYYDCSPGAEELIGWHVNKGASAAADFFPASRFRASNYRPDVIDRILETMDETKAVQLADEERGRQSAAVDVAKQLPPVAAILSPADGARMASSSVTLRYAVRTPADAPVTGVKILIDGRPVGTERGVKVVPDQAAEASLTINIPERDCEVSIIAENRNAASVPATIRLIWEGKKPSAEAFIALPKLYVLAIGVSAYQNKNHALRYAAKDATDLAAVLKRQEGGMYREVVTKVLTDAGATRDDILDGLEWLQKETTSRDVAVLFLAGHGVNDPAGIYYFLPQNMDLEKLKRTGVPFSDIKNTLSSLAGKVVLFVDTCHSGNVMGGRRGVSDVTDIVNELASAENGTVVFASSTGRQYSLEDEKWGNGAFTKALVEGLDGKADYTGKGKITVNMLDVYLSERVKELTGGKQTPTTTKPETVPDFPLAIKR
jgi:WD40 repeat protein